MGETAALIAAMLWAYASIEFARVGQRTSPLAINLLKCTGGMICLGLIWWIVDGATIKVELSDYEWFYLVLSAVIGLLIGDTFFFLALRDLGAGMTLLVSALIPPVTAVIAGVWIGEGLILQEWLGLIITGSGVCLVIAKQALKVASLRRGLIFAVLLVVSTAVGNVMVKVGGARLDGLAIAVIRLAVAAVGLWLTIALLRRLPELMVPWQSPRSDKALIKGTIAGTVIGIWLLMIGFSQANVAVATAMAGTSPVWVLPLAYWLEGDRPSARSVLGALIAVSGLLVLGLA
jgi:drug/metabolite transporter (DMT)-like permease